MITLHGIMYDCDTEEEAIALRDFVPDADVEAAILVAEASIAYRRNRAKAYPSLQDQADMQFHDLVNGTTTWLDAIQAVKDTYPKPV